MEASAAPGAPPQWADASANACTAAALSEPSTSADRRTPATQPPPPGRSGCPATAPDSSPAHGNAHSATTRGGGPASAHRTQHHQLSRQPCRRSTLPSPQLAPALWPWLLLLPLLAPPRLLPYGAVRLARASLERFYGNVTYPLDEQLAYCDTLGPLYDGIAADLRHWAASGITAAALEEATQRYTTEGKQKGMTLAFYGGVPYVVVQPRLEGLGHHVNILFTYMLVMLDLARQYGTLLPDAEFVIASSDRPLVLLAAADPAAVPPVLRFCSSDDHADIKIPIFHFYTKKYTHTILAHADRLATTYPWAQRKPIVFGRFSKYYRHIHPLANSTLRLGAGNTSICRQESTNTLTCPARAYFMQWAARAAPSRIDVRSGPRVSLAKHAAYKYLLHLDGQALSSRLEQLLPLRSLILKEESGYKTFYYHLVRPYEHYVPVWKAGGGPEDVLAALEWAQAHDEQAERMAAAAQEVALRYLSKRARSCYWLRLFQAYAKLQRFTPSRERRPYAVRVEEYLETVGRRFERGKQLHKIEY